MMQRVRKVQYTGDPLTLPARSNEIECLVRFFYKLSARINETVRIVLKSFHRFSHSHLLHFSLCFHMDVVCR